MSELIKRQTVKDRVEENNFYKKPVDDIITKIKTSEEDKIIITGARGCGKTTVLNSLTNDSIYTKDVIFITDFDGVGLFPGIKENREILYEHYYELIMTSRLLHFINNYYNDIYDIYFKDLHMEISNLIEELNLFIRNYVYTDKYKIEKFYKIGELIEMVINKFREILKLEKFNLAIDRFDWIDNRNALSQEILNEYFKYFDKNIITSDDITIKNKKIDLSKKGFKVLEVDYGKNHKIIKEIIRRYALYYNSHLEGSDKYFPFDEIMDEVFKNITGLANGDIHSILMAMQNTSLIFDWTWKFDLNKQIVLEVEKELQKRLEIENISGRKILHL